MSRTQQEIQPVDSVRFTPELSFFQAPPSRQAEYQGAAPVDGVSISNESHGVCDEYGEDLCSQFLAAWD